jgi:hypothetical protein
MKSRHAKAAKKLYGPTIQYADGTVVKGKPLDIEHILHAFEELDSSSRSSFLCVLAHDLTAAIRALLLDRPVPETDLDRVCKINEFLHQLTSCVDPRRRWRAHDEALLVRSIIETSFDYDLDRWVGHALAAAAESTIGTENTVAAQPGAA